MNVKSSLSSGEISVTGVVERVNLVGNGTGVTPDISMTATVDNTVGTPSVAITKTGTSDAPNFALAFTGLKGNKGDKGDKGDKGAQGAQGVQGIQGFKGDTGATGAKGDKGDKGDTGATPAVSATATVDSTVGTPSVVVNNTGTESAPNFNFAFSGIKGEKGDKGIRGAQGADGITPEITM